MEIKYSASNLLASPRPVFGLQDLSKLTNFHDLHSKNLKEDMTIVEWGCGDAKFFNYLSRRLKNFQYYGLELWQTALDYAQEDYGHDARAHFGLIGSEVEKEALEKADAVVSISFFCHTPFKFFVDSVNKMMPILKKGKLSASVFLQENSMLHSPNFLGIPDFYAMSIYKERDFWEFIEAEGLIVEPVGEFHCDNLHKVFDISV